MTMLSFQPVDPKRSYTEEQYLASLSGDPEKSIASPGRQAQLWYHEYELNMGPIPMQLFWPPKDSADVKANRVYGLDFECECFALLTDQLAADWPAYGVNKQMTRLELTVAMTIANRAKRSGADVPLTVKVSP